jgi:hypothetical protein
MSSVGAMLAHGRGDMLALGSIDVGEMIVHDRICVGMSFSLMSDSSEEIAVGGVDSKVENFVFGCSFIVLEHLELIIAKFMVSLKVRPTHSNERQTMYLHKLYALKL